MSAKNLLLVITYPTPPYMYLREILRIPAAKPPRVRPRLLMDTTIKYIPGQGIKLLKPGRDETKDFEGSDAERKPPKCTPRQNGGKVSLKDKKQKWVVHDSTGHFLLAQNLINGNEKANFEYINYNDTSFGGGKQPISLKFGDSYLCCNENAELTLEVPQNGGEDLCDIKGSAIKYVFLQSKSSPYTNFESAKFRGKYICTTGDDSPRVALALLNDNEKIFDFEVHQQQQQRFITTDYTRPPKLIIYYEFFYD
ncbi:uncharacterized protein [Hyperolius riggenbachi]|uniref:uncharacterized protein n=1 Tax=Hyperolius riggenbachi TaxID=752182 RepID=UPI0035A3421C